MKKHEIKTWPDYYFRIFAGSKKFEVRKNDRDYQIGDILYLREYDPAVNDYTGREMYCSVTYIIHGGSFGIEEGYCVMSIVQTSL